MIKNATSIKLTDAELQRIHTQYINDKKTNTGNIQHVKVTLDRNVQKIFIVHTNRFGKIIVSDF